MDIVQCIDLRGLKERVRSQNRLIVLGELFSRIWPDKETGCCDGGSLEQS